MEKGSAPPAYNPAYPPAYPQPQPGMPPQPGMQPQPGMAPPNYSQAQMQGQAYPPAPPGYAPQGYAPPPQGYAQPQQGYAPVPQQQYVVQPTTGYVSPAQTIQVVQVVPQMRFGETPISMNCPKCEASIITGTEYQSGTMAWLACLGICGIGLFLSGITWLGCCLIPFCVSACKDVEHTCPNCNRTVGRFNRM